MWSEDSRALVPDRTSVEIPWGERLGRQKPNTLPSAETRMNVPASKPTRPPPHTITEATAEGSPRTTTSLSSAGGLIPKPRGADGSSGRASAGGSLAGGSGTGGSTGLGGFSPTIGGSRGGISTAAPAIAN